MILSGIGVGFSFLLSIVRAPLDLPTHEAVVAAVAVRGVTIPVVVADTAEKRTQGLSGRASLPADGGMFFDMKTVGKHGIWMKNMAFPIDIVWIDEGLKIVTIVESARPDSYPKVFYPEVPAMYVLEVNAGFIEKRDISVGDVITVE